MKRTLKTLGIVALLIMALFDPSTWFSVIFWFFRKVGLFFRYAIYLLLGKKKPLKYLDRLQRDPNWFSQRGINTFWGFVIVTLSTIYLIYR